MLAFLPKHRYLGPKWKYLRLRVRFLVQMDSPDTALAMWLTQRLLKYYHSVIFLRHINTV